MPVKVKETAIGGRLGDFLNVVDDIYREDAQYVRPLDMELKMRLSPKNPFFEHGEGVIFTAHRNGSCVGRCTATIDQLHLERHKEDVGFFGFFDTLEDEEAAVALLRSASGWLRARGMKKIRGPFSLSINEESGCLVSGFDTPPMIMCAHHRPYQGGLIERAGLVKKKDLYGWRYQIEGHEIPRRALGAIAELEALPEVETRTMDRKNLERDVRLVMEVFNDAWAENWGFIPLTEAELSQMAKDMKLILHPDLTYLTLINGEPAAFCVAMPNLNEAIADLNGKLGPIGIAKLLWRLKVRHTSTARLVLLGIKKKFRRMRRYKAMSFFMYGHIHMCAVKYGAKHAELGWTLEDNFPVNVGIKAMGGDIYKTYRVYEGEL